jgi:hypothetical protein
MQMENKENKKWSFHKLSKRQSIAVVVVIMLVTSFGSYFVAGALAPIWSPPSGPAQSNPTPSPTPVPTPVAFAGTLSAVTWNTTSPATFTVGDKLVLATTLAPAPARTQSVTFFYSTTAIAVSDGVPTNPAQLVSIASVSSVGSTASYTVTVPFTGQLYFIAKISVPA